MMLNRDQADRFARLPLAGTTRIYPNQIAHAMHGPEDVGAPEALHPIFYGCYDWHSAVHGHWLLARCLHRYPDLAVGSEIEALFDRHLTVAAGATEAAYFQARAGFERPYGWAWLLVLVAELRRLDHPRAQVWTEALVPLERVLTEYLAAYLKRLSYPVRAGTHANTGFALIPIRHALSGTTLCQDIDAAARRYFQADRDYPVAYEPSGEDFLSPGLVEAALLAQILPPDGFAHWFATFLPAGADGFQPAFVSDRSDGRIAHLDGLNLSRAWCLRLVAAALGDRPDLLAAANVHEAASLPHVTSGHYEGEHWLATFAALAIEGL